MAVDDSRTLTERLTPREKEMLRLVWRHMSSKQIAASLGVQPDTVDQTIKRALRKLGYSDRRQAAALLIAAEDGGAPPPVPIIGTSPSPVLPEPTPAVPYDRPSGEPVGGSLQESRTEFLVGLPKRPRGLARLKRGKGGRNDLSTRERLTLILNGVALLALAVLAFTCALLVYTSVRRELLRSEHQDISYAR